MEDELNKNLNHLLEQLWEMEFESRMVKVLIPALVISSQIDEADRFVISADRDLSKYNHQYLLLIEREDKSHLYNIVSWNLSRKQILQSGLSQHNDVTNGSGDKTTIERTFWRQGNSIITRPEAENLFESRAVFKRYLMENGEERTSWFRMIPGSFPEDLEPGRAFFNGQQTFTDFDLKEAIQRYPFVNKGEFEFEALIAGLKRGDRCEIPIVRNAKEEIFFTEANPEQQTVDVFDRGGNKISIAEFKTDNKQKNRNNKNKGRGKSM